MSRPRTTATTLVVSAGAALLVPTGTANAADEVLRCAPSASIFATGPDGALQLYRHDEPELGEHLRAGSSLVGNGCTVPMTGSDWERSGGSRPVGTAEDWDDRTSVASRERVPVDPNATRRVLETGAANRYDVVVAAGDGMSYAHDPHVLNGVSHRYECHAVSQRFLKPFSGVTGKD